MKPVIVGAIVATMLLSSLCLAKPAIPREQAKSRVQRMTFRDDPVLAGRDTGGGALVKGEIRMRFSRLIKPRVNFLPEMIRSAENI